MERSSSSKRWDLEGHRDSMSEPVPLLAPTLNGKASTERPEALDLEAGEGDQPQCRICLETNGRDLIAPCRCRGSAKYVHRGCLDRWRSTKEGFAFAHCSTCRMPFHLRVHVPADKQWRTLKFRFFVTRDLLLVTAAVQLIIVLLGYGVYRIDHLQAEHFRKTFKFDYVVPFYYFCGVAIFLVMAGIMGCVWTCYDRRIRADFSEPCRDACLCCCHPWVCGDCYMCLWLDCTTCCEGCVASAGECFTAAGSMGELGAAFFMLLAVLVLGFLAVFGLFYSLLVVTMVVQRIWQRHNHVLAKRMLSKEYVVEDLDGESLSSDWRPPPLPAEHVQQLKDLGLL